MVGLGFRDFGLDAGFRVTNPCPKYRCTAQTPETRAAHTHTHTHTLSLSATISHIRHCPNMHQVPQHNYLMLCVTNIDIYIYICICKYTCIHICMYVHMCIYVRVCICLCVRMCTYMYIYIWLSNLCTSMILLHSMYVFVAVHSSVLQRVALYCSVLQGKYATGSFLFCAHVAGCIRVLQGVPVRCSAMQRGAVWCSAMQFRTSLICSECYFVYMTVSTEIATPPKSTKLRNLDSSESFGTT